MSRRPNAGSTGAPQGPRASDKDSANIADLVTVLHQEQDDVFARRQLLAPVASPQPPKKSKSRDEQAIEPATEPSLATYYDRAHACGDLSALCLSGGGIRSAAFALGIMQGLAHHRILHRFDYLSTVSGGGYIGSWLTSWVHRCGYKATLAALPSAREADAQSPLFHLSRYSNYLTPRAGLLSADTLTLVALYVRNLLLNWLIILPFILGAIIFIKIFAILAWVPLDPVEGVPPGRVLGGLLAIAVTLIGEALLDSLLQRPGWESKPSSSGIFWKAELLPLLVGSGQAASLGPDRS